MKILLIAGHGNGDPGAVGNGYQESDLTREVVKLVASKLAAYGTGEVLDTANNWYRQICVNGGYFNFTPYDYVLEVHFNSASGTSADGVTTGTEIYVTTSEKTVSVEENIVKGIASLGFENRGVKTKNFSLIQYIKNQGVSSALLEVCFVSDADDMKLYASKKNEIADAIVKGIADGFKLQKTVSEPWYSEAQKWAVNKGITDGTRPNDTTTRAEVWTMLQRLFEG